MPATDELVLDPSTRIAHVKVQASSNAFVSKIAFFDASGSLIVMLKSLKSPHALASSHSEQDFHVPAGHSLIGLQTTHRHDNYLVGVGFLTVQI